MVYFGYLFVQIFARILLLVKPVVSVLLMSYNQKMLINKFLPGTVQRTSFVKIAHTYLQQANHIGKIKNSSNEITLLFFMRTQLLTVLFLGFEKIAYMT